MGNLLVQKNYTDNAAIKNTVIILKPNKIDNSKSTGLLHESRVFCPKYFSANI